MSFLQVIPHSGLEEVLYEDFEIKYNMFLSIPREPLISEKEEKEVFFLLFPNKSTALHHWDTSNKLEYI
jgi:hypothetical protein